MGKSLQSAQRFPSPASGNVKLTDNPNKPPHTYPPDFPAGIIKEYAMRYRLLYKIKHGIPLPPGKDLRSYFRLELITRAGSCLHITQKTEELYFTPQSFYDEGEPNGTSSIQTETPSSNTGRDQENSRNGWPF